MKLYEEEVKIFNQEISFQKNDNDLSVRQLAAALRREPVTFFLTLTCNQKKHPGVAPLLKAIYTFYMQSPKEIKRESVNIYMSTLVRCWSRSIKYFINLITKSAESLIGEVIKIWGRAEFQSTSHVLLWVQPGTYDFEKLIQGSEKSIFFSFNEMFESKVSCFDTPSDMMERYDECVRIHTHSCEKSGFRCMKRKNVEGNKDCRTPPYPHSEHNWKLDIIQQYPQNVLSYLFQLGHAAQTDKAYIVLPPLNCAKWMYSATNGEHLLPTSVPLFAITESSVTLLRCTGQFSCNYLTRYAEKSEKHAEGKIACGAAGKSFRLRDEGIKIKV